MEQCCRDLEWRFLIHLLGASFTMKGGILHPLADLSSERGKTGCYDQGRTEDCSELEEGKCREKEKEKGNGGREKRKRRGRK